VRSDNVADVARRETFQETTLLQLAKVSDRAVRERGLIDRWLNAPRIVVPSGAITAIARNQDPVMLDEVERIEI
jgi:hypothetical protein